jgi:hypothetical protein
MWSAAEWLPVHEVQMDFLLLARGFFSGLGVLLSPRKNCHWEVGLGDACWYRIREAVSARDLASSKKCSYLEKL